jgi:hypothetical protein
MPDATPGIEIPSYVHGGAGRLNIMPHFRNSKNNEKAGIFLKSRLKHEFLNRNSRTEKTEKN